jgi:hypothetical protein
MICKITKAIVAAFILLISMPEESHAQFTRIGGGLSFSTGIENEDFKTGNPGISARGVLEFGEKFWLIPTLSFYMPGKRQLPNSGGLQTTWFGTLDADFTYAMAHEGAILFYALAGANVSLLSSSFKTGDLPSATKVMPALNVGTGIEMIVEKDLNAFAQIKGVIGSYSQYLVIGIGVHYYFSGRRYKSW